ncbi:MAG: polyprenyl synthetase family protein [Dehalococcoidia bacterium]|nr:polyprenyl synthetase family protein [Dehalococcoidia bacterium]
MSIASIYEPIQEGLGMVEEKLKDFARVDFPWIVEPLTYVLESSGKRIRPGLTLLAGRFYRYDLETLIPMATAIELFHNATLVHDDAVDKALLRRGKTAVNSLWGEGIAVLLGDYLFSISADLVCSIGNFRVMSLFAKTLTEISSGQLRETFNAYSWRQDREGYYEQIYSKTASLFAAATGTGAVLSEAPEEAVAALTSYGSNLGMAFQVVDDVLDVIGDEGEMGKPVGSDLLQGTLTLPIILLVEQHPQDNVLGELPEKPGDQVEVARVIEMVRNSPVVDECYQIAGGFLSQACGALEGLPDNVSRRSLLDLADYVIERRK